MCLVLVPASAAAARSFAGIPGHSACFPFPFHSSWIARVHALTSRPVWMLQRGTPPPCGCFRSEDLAVYCQLPRVGRCGFDLVDGEALDGLRRSRVAERLVDE